MQKEYNNLKEESHKRELTLKKELSEVTENFVTATKKNEEITNENKNLKELISTLENSRSDNDDEVFDPNSHIPKMKPFKPSVKKNHLHLTLNLGLKI